jgi:[acyl-carrier-protein] S-malonyltransferase
MTTALLFPGQGSQRVGMGRDLAIAHDVAKSTYAEADDVLGFSLSALCWDGPEDELTLTKHTQPAILATSIAVFRCLLEQGLAFDQPAAASGGAGGRAQVSPVVIAAGHSLGEWTALVATGAIGFADAIRLTHLRGQLMQEAVPPGAGAMAALMGLDLATVGSVCANASRPGEPVEPANLNGAGAKRAMKLPVSAPFHCSLMAPAADRLAAELANVKISAPSVPVIANVTAEPHTTPDQIRALLVEQVTATVRWEESVKAIAARGVTTAYELGSGAVLKGLVKRIAETITVTTIGEPHEVAAFTA